MTVRRLHILCEGQTEETIVREVVVPYLTTEDTCVTHSILTTKRPAAGGSFKGGVSTWNRVRAEVRRLLNDSSLTVLTTLIDYYGAPTDTPGMADRPAGTPHERVAHVERAMAAVVDDSRFVPHLVLHETEAWVLACCEALEIVTGDPKLPAAARTLITQAGGAELVNDGKETAPSKRLQKLYPRYRKTSDGPDAICLTGVEEIRAQCPHADLWFGTVETRLTTGP